MIIIRVEDDHSVHIFDEDTTIDANDCCEVEAEFDELTIKQCLNYYKLTQKKNKKILDR